MSDVPLDVPAHESGKLRLFGIETQTAEGAALRTAAAAGDAEALAAALGAARIEASRVGLVAVDDVAELGLAGYLSAGYDVPQEQLDAAAERLAAAPPHLLVVSSGALGDAAQTLSPDPALRPVAHFDLSTPLPPRTTPPTYTEPAADLASPRAEQAGRRRRRGPVPLILTAVALVLLLLAIRALA